MSRYFCQSCCRKDELSGGQSRAQLAGLLAPRGFLPWARSGHARRRAPGNQRGRLDPGSPSHDPSLSSFPEVAKGSSPRTRRRPCTAVAR